MTVTKAPVESLAFTLDIKRSGWSRGYQFLTQDLRHVIGHYRIHPRNMDHHHHMVVETERPPPHHKDGGGSGGDGGDGGDGGGREVTDSAVLSLLTEVVSSLPPEGVRFVGVRSPTWARVQSNDGGGDHHPEKRDHHHHPPPPPPPAHHRHVHEYEGGTCGRGEGQPTGGGEGCAATCTPTYARDFLLKELRKYVID